MSDLHSLVEYFSVARPLIVLGAGPSCEIGLPAWQPLAEKILELARQFPGEAAEFADVAFAKREFAKVMEYAVKAAGEQKVYDLCRSLLTDTGVSGKQYKLITQLPALGFLTTNFDSILKRHFREAGKAATELLNLPSDLEVVDFEAQRTIVKIHGDLSLLGRLVLTDSQYRQVIHSAGFTDLRAFI